MSTLTPQILEGLLHQACTAAEQAGSLIRNRFQKPYIVKLKGKYDLGLDVDSLSEELIIRHLSSLDSSIAIASEEKSPFSVEHLRGTSWIVDPLDGTNNFASGIGYLAISIGLLVDGKMQFALVHDPLTRSTCKAMRGSGASIGNRQLRLDHAPPPSKGVVSVVTDYSEGARLTGLRLATELRTVARRVITMWAPAADLSRVASGLLDGVVSYRAAFGDVGPGLLLVAEAGGCIVDQSGRTIDPSELDQTCPLTFVAAYDRRRAHELFENSLAQL